MIKKLILAWALCLAAASPGWAASEGIAWDKFPTDRMRDLAALQNGAKLFVNYCLGCHQAAFVRYNRMRDIGLTEEQIKDNLIFTGAKVGELMHAAIDPKDAKEWFGGLPPDLALVARSRSSPGQGSGADYIYTLLRNYYRDPTKATGWNNAAFPSIGMPHPLWELQGQQRAVFVDRKDAHDPNKTVHELKGYEPITAGTLSAEQYRLAVADLVAFLQWMAEPMQATRVRIGVWVLLFLAVFYVIAWRLNAAFWKDVK